MLALRERFELPRGVSLNSSQGCRRGPLGYLSTYSKSKIQSRSIDIKLVTAAWDRQTFIVSMDSNRVRSNTGTVNDRHYEVISDEVDQRFNASITCRFCHDAGLYRLAGTNTDTDAYAHGYLDANANSGTDSNGSASHVRHLHAPGDHEWPHVPVRDYHSVERLGEAGRTGRGRAGQAIIILFYFYIRAMKDLL